MNSSGKRKYYLTLIISGAGLLLFAFLCVCVGKYGMSPSEAFSALFSRLPQGAGGQDMQSRVVFGLRLPRILASVLVGAALSTSGAAYQGIFKNPLVSPDLLGVSMGACVGAAIAILLSLGSVFIQLFAFAGGLVAVLLTTSIPRLLGSESNIMLVLSGIIVGGLMASVFGLLKYLADPETQLASIVYWNMGSFADVKFANILPVLPLIVIPLAALAAISWRINILSLGEREAAALGVNVKRVRGIALVCATLATASSICIAGTISWVGLVIPHFVRQITGSDNTRLIPAGIIIGGLFMLLVDTAARTIGPLELPISILTGIIGAPFFAWLLYRQRRAID